MQRASGGPRLDGRGFFGRVGERQQPTLLHDVRKEPEDVLIRTEYFTDQHNAQQGRVRCITMGTAWFHGHVPRGAAVLARRCIPGAVRVVTETLRSITTGARQDMKVR